MFPLMGALMTSQEVINVEYVGKFLAQLRNLIKMDLQKVHQGPILRLSKGVTTYRSYHRAKLRVSSLLFRLYSVKSSYKTLWCSL